MGLDDFKGGIHPKDKKEMVKNSPVKTLFPKADLIYHLSQHIGKEAVPIVKEGDTVLAGQKIAEASGFISANIISSVSGRVKKIAPAKSISGALIPSIIVENDGLYNTVPEMGKSRDYETLSNEEILHIIKEAGIVGMGGAGFPTHIKLNPKNPDAIEYVILNGAECEPYIVSDYRLMLEKAEQIIKGLKIELKLFKNAKGIIAIEDNKKDAAEIFESLTKDEPNITVSVLKTKYPQGGERVLVYAVTGKRLNSSLLPADLGCIVTNVSTAYAIYEAVCKSTPLISRIITVTGIPVKNPSNFEVRIGTDIGELIEASGGFTESPEKVLSGGPMMGFAMESTSVPIVKSTTAILCLNKEETLNLEENSCIRCGRCISVCPARLNPQILKKYTQVNDLKCFEEQNGKDCFECGCCSYTCPAKLKLTQSFSKAKKSIMEGKSK